jgi:hypothetical protein
MASSPSALIRWPVNVASAVRACLEQDISLRRDAETNVTVRPSILTDIGNIYIYMGRMKKEGIFLPRMAASVFKAHYRSVAQPLQGEATGPNSTTC